jgi:outer membrane lipoprotein-sorting protein
MLHLKTITALLACGLLLAPLAVRSDGPAAPQQLTADFVMTRTIKALADSIRSSGKLHLGGVGLLRFEMTAPSRSVLVVNGERGWIHYPDMDMTREFELAADPVMRLLSAHMLALTSGDFARVGELYEVTELEDGVKRLVPREAGIRKVFAELRLALARPGVIAWVELRSTGGDRTRIEFTNVRTDQPIDPALFRAPGK